MDLIEVLYLIVLLSFSILVLLGWFLFLELNVWVYVRNVGSEEQGDVIKKKKNFVKSIYYVLVSIVNFCNIEFIYWVYK